MSDEKPFQNEDKTIIWKLHFVSSPEKVYKALTDPKQRKGYWAESAEEVEEGLIHYKFLNGIEDKGRVLEQVENVRYCVNYFNWRVTFELTPDGKEGTDMLMTCQDVHENLKTELIAGWVSWLMAMKAWVDFDVDLRNHDPKRTWFDGFADN